MAGINAGNSIKKKNTTSSSSSSSSTTSSSSSKNTSTGTTGTTTYDANTDYSKLIADAAAQGDYKAAAQYEQLRNQKIAGTGSSYAPTNNYAGWLDTDYSVLGQQQMSDGASWQDVLTTYNNRYNKAMTTEGLNQYANDEIQRQMWEYIQNGIAAEGNPENYLDDFTYDEQKPTYNNQYDPAIQELVNQILNRDDFSYDAQNDPLYQQYASMYAREGDRAMRDTLAEAAASAGGMNSYAITAAQQANNNYMAQLNDKIPELYQLAYQMYLQDKESKVQDLGILQSLDSTDYNRYRDTISDFYADKNFAYNQYMDAVAQGQWDKTFAYNQAVDERDYYANMAQNTINNQWAEKEWNNAINQQTIQNNRYDAEIQREDALLAKEEARSWAESLLAQGVMPSDELLNAAGISAVDASAYVASVKAYLAASLSSGGGGGGGGGSAVGSLVSEFEPIIEAVGKWLNESTNSTGINYSDVPDLGIGMMNDEALAKLIVKGMVVVRADGSVEWADGWDADKYKTYLENLPVRLPGFDGMFS